jgi:hypothetical protein
LLLVFDFDFAIGFWLLDLGFDFGFGLWIWAFGVDFWLVFSDFCHFELR